ncbi:MAG: hypothetical protein J7545_04800 [Roseofilum sp. SBFL]|nr:hypothetical protein [Roseofilum sp. SBFL]
MSSLIKNVVSQADSQSRYLSREELDLIKNFEASGKQRLRIAEILSDSCNYIIKQAGDLLFQVRPDIIAPGGNAYGEKMTATCLRDLDYYLRIVTYGIVAGDVTPIEQMGIIGAREMYNSLGTPISAVAEGILAIKLVSSSLLSKDDAVEANAYFDYIIAAFDGVSKGSYQAMQKLIMQQPGTANNLKPQAKPENSSTEPWEPKSPTEWLNLDRLAQQLLQNGVDNQDTFKQSAIAFFETWKLMPQPIRKQIWREREVMAALCSHMNDWAKIPGFSHIGVAKKPLGEQEELVGLITLNFPADDYFYNQFGIPRFIEIDSLISDFANQKQVRILLECAFPTSKYSNFPVSQDALPGTIPALSTLTKTSLQSGDLIIGSNKNGHVNEKKAVTLTTFVVSQANSETIEPQAMSVRHGFTAGYTEINACASQMSTKIGRVFYKSASQQEQSEKLDISLIKLEGCIKLNPFLKWVEATPGKPFLAWSGMLVQMYGGVSGHTTGYVNHSMVVFPGASSSVVPEFTAIIQSQPGDSGSLLVAGNVSGDPILDAEVKGLDPSQIENLRFAMVGMLIGGAPSGGSYTNLTYFRPIVDICQQLRVKPYLEKHLLIGKSDKETPISRTIQWATE